MIILLLLLLILPALLYAGPVSRHHSELVTHSHRSSPSSSSYPPQSVHDQQDPSSQVSDLLISRLTEDITRRPHHASQAWDPKIPVFVTRDASKIIALSKFYQLQRLRSLQKSQVEAGEERVPSTLSETPDVSSESSHVEPSSPQPPADEESTYDTSQGDGDGVEQPDSSVTEKVDGSNGQGEEQGQTQSQPQPQSPSSGDERMVTVYHPILPGPGKIMIPEGYELDSVQPLPPGTSYSPATQNEYEVSYAEEAGGDADAGGSEASSEQGAASVSADTGSEQGETSNESSEETQGDPQQQHHQHQPGITSHDNEESMSASPALPDYPSSPELQGEEQRGREERPRFTTLHSSGSSYSPSPGQPEELLRVPVITFSGSGRSLSSLSLSPSRQGDMMGMKEYQVVPVPAPEAVPQVTRDAIQVNPSLTSRQKNYLSKVLDDYYQFILKTQKELRAGAGATSSSSSPPASRRLQLLRRPNGGRLSSIFLWRRNHPVPLLHPLQPRPPHVWRSLFLAPSSPSRYRPSLIPISVRMEKKKKKKKKK